MKLAVLLLLLSLAFQVRSAEVVSSTLSISRGMASMHIDEHRIVDIMNQHFRINSIGPNTDLGKDYLFSEWGAVDFVVRVYQQHGWAYPGSLQAIRDGFGYAGCIASDGPNSTLIQTPRCIAKAFAYAKAREANRK